MLDSCSMSELPLPPKELQYPKGRTFGFVEGGKRVFDQLVGFGGLKPEDKVLDAGCGVGRVARHLTGYLTGSYEGFDVVPKAIAWCQEAITPRYPQFRFTLAELHNQLASAFDRVPRT
jgi:cyclopropane fatty-acyl-phospholipid synthase-like methyltransferase